MAGEGTLDMVDGQRDGGDGAVAEGSDCGEEYVRPGLTATQLYLQMLVNMAGAAVPNSATAFLPLV